MFTYAPSDKHHGSTERAECFGEPVPSIDRPLWEMLDDTAARFPDHEAVVSLWQKPGTYAPELLSSDPKHRGRAGTGIRWSYPDLVEKSTHLANCLKVRGCRCGMHLLVALGNSAEWAMFFWASARLGMVFIPVDPRSTDTQLEDYVRTTKPQVVVAQDIEISQRLHGVLLRQSGSESQAVLVRITCSLAADDNWETLGDILRASDDAAPEETSEDPPPQTSADDPAVIVFTSGTTGTPKACVHSVSNIWSQVCDFDPDPEHCKDRWCVHTSMSHIFGINNSARAWRFGGTVVFPSRSFDVKGTLRALTEEKCTFMSAVPALVKGLMADPDFPGRDKLHLKYVSLGSQLITEDDIRLCRDNLLHTQDAIQCYGMSEGAPITSFTRDDPLIHEKYHPGCGKVVPGGNIRICAPGTREVLARDEEGELHIGGTSVIKGYYGGTAQNEFYSDPAGNWFVTGDRASIDAHGVLRVVGRYKDIIIRGGSNIAPIVIEKALNEMDGVISQVVGIPDAFAGQVPVAVIKAPEGVTKRAVSEKAASLGKEFVLAAVYFLEELGLSSFPVTLTGKVKKDELKAAIARRLQGAHMPPAETSNALSAQLGMIKTELQGIWADLIGIKPSYTEAISSFADSITILRFCDKVTTKFGKRIYLQDFLCHPSIDTQAELLQDRSNVTRHHQEQEASFPLIHLQGSVPSHPGRPPRRRSTTGGSVRNGKIRSPQVSFSSISMTNLWAPVGRQTQQLHHDAAAVVEANGLDLADAEEIVHIRDGLRRLASGPRPQSYHVRFAMHIREATAGQVRQALQTGLGSRSMFRTLLCESDSGLAHVVLKASQPLYSHLIESITVPDDASREKHFNEDSSRAFSPVFMFQAKIITVESSGDVYLMTTTNHSTFDALSFISWHQDLDRLVANPGYAVPPLTPYKMFADLTHMYQTSLPAQASVDFNVQRLRGISKFTSALWPPQRAPGWYQSNDADAPHAAERERVRESVWAGSWPRQKPHFRIPRRTRVVNLPHMEVLRTQERVEPSLLAKAAVAIFNVYRTGQPYALFSHLDAARSWPFVPAWMERGILPPPMSIDGPTFEFVLNMTSVDIRRSRRRRRRSRSRRSNSDDGNSDSSCSGKVGGGGEDDDDETLREFLARMHEEHEELGRHAHAPWTKVLEGLGGAEAEAAIDASCRQTFVWDVSLRLMNQRAEDLMGFERIRVIGRWDWADCGIYWNCCMLDKENMGVIATWDTAQMNDSEVDDHCDVLADVVRRLADRGNLDKGLGEVFGGALGRAAYG
ncbi:acetyl-CoA synthetase-like protein [Xylariomycetidae sp. FL2044]|nr:acetyl-CoA synthetase-like protein [Xylariomycetidae sp. FL2044]